MTIPSHQASFSLYCPITHQPEGVRGSFPPEYNYKRPQIYRQSEKHGIYVKGCVTMKELMIWRENMLGGLANMPLNTFVKYIKQVQFTEAHAHRSAFRGNLNPCVEVV